MFRQLGHACSAPRAFQVALKLVGARTSLRALGAPFWRPLCGYARVMFVAVLLHLCFSASGQVSVEKPCGNRQQADEDNETVVILEIGAATSWDVKGGAATFAPNLAAETTLKENWLEIAAGVSPFYTRNTTEWDTDLLFKKPWTLSRKAEFMAGVGPVWEDLKQNGKVVDSISGEVAGDFMFWPTRKHRFGWFLEPAYDYSFAGGHQQSLGISGGLLIGIPGPHLHGT